MHLRVRDCANRTLCNLYQIRDVLVNMLSNLGYNTYTVNDGIEAVDYYINNHKNTDIVILDMVMPKMDGHDCYNELKKINRDVKAVLLTGYIQDNKFTSITADGINAIITKPFTFSHLAQVLTDILNKEQT